MNLQLESLYQNIKDLLIEARRKAYVKVNFIMVESYWEVGRMIVEEEQDGKDRAAYGKQILQFLSQKLTHDFGEGFDARNLRYMRAFYQHFPIWNAVRSELTWTHYRILSKVENEKARWFYVQEAIDCQWNTRELERQIHSFYYQRMVKTQEQGLMVREQNDIEKMLPSDIIKDPYVLEFLNLSEKGKFKEGELEQALIDKLQAFLLELGKGFAFVAQQKRISAEEDHFSIDLVFYNYLLKCFVLVDLKVGKLTHKDIGQMDFYVRYWEDNLKSDGDSPTIGLILCTEKNETVVKYSVLQDNQQLFVSKYKLFLPTEEELRIELEREKQFLQLRQSENAPPQ